MTSFKKLIALLLAALLALGLTGCAMNEEDLAAAGQAVSEIAAALEELSEAEEAPARETAPEDALTLIEESPAEEAPAEEAPAEEAPEEAPEEEPEEPAEESPEEAPEEEPTEEEQTLDPDGWYTTKEDVALYLHLYGELPGNFITKSEARALGWEGGGLDDYADGKSIGGDRFGNYEGLLPEGDYHECDIGTMHATKRGAERIIWSDDGRIYYTNDHYESFTLLYGEE